MRFDRHTRESSFSYRRSRSRLVRLVALMALVLVLIQYAKRPAAWHWFVQMADPAAATDPSSTTAPLKPIQIQRGAASTPLAGGDVYARVDESDRPPEVTPLEPVTAAAPPGSAPAANSLGLPPEAFTGVVDDWFGMTRAEQPALGLVLARVQALGPAVIDKVADREVTFEGLLGNPDYYRGRAVFIRGELRRCTRGRIGTGENSRAVWEAWIVTPDSRNTPYLVYAVDIPSAMPSGEKLQEPVELSGVFVRRFAYAAVGGEAISPLLVTPRLEWAPAAPPVEQRISREMRWSTLVFVAGLACVLLCVGGWYLLSDRRYRRSHLHAIAESRLDATASDLQVLSDLDRGDPHRIQIDEALANEPGHPRS